MVTNIEMYLNNINNQNIIKIANIGKTLISFITLATRMAQNLLESLTISGRNEVSKWIERFEALCLLMDYQEPMKVNVLVTYTGPVAYETLHAALSPKHPKD